jgi:hypothetical protein
MIQCTRIRLVVSKKPMCRRWGHFLAVCTISYRRSSKEYLASPCCDSAVYRSAHLSRTCRAALLLTGWRECTGRKLRISSHPIRSARRGASRWRLFPSVRDLRVSSNGHEGHDGRSLYLTHDYRSITTIRNDTNPINEY